MGKITGFMEIARQDRTYVPVPERIKFYKEFVRPLSDADLSKQGARCMDCGIPFCQSGCPVNNIIPDWNDLVFRGNWQRGARGPAFHEQLSRVHRTRLPGAVRSVVRAQHQQRPGGDQVDRAGDRRQGLAGRLDRAAAAGKKDRQTRRRGRLGARGHGLRAATCPRRARRRAVREERPHRRPAALRHPGLQDGEVAHRPAHRADARRGRDVPPECPRRREVSRRQVARRVRCGGARRRRGTPARPARSRPRTARHPVRDGFPAAAEQARGRRRSAAGRSRPRASTWS